MSATLESILNPVNTVATSGASQTLTFYDSTTYVDRVHDVTLTANCTFSFSGFASGRMNRLTLILRQDATASRVATWPTNVAWSGQAAPIFNLAATKYDVLEFITMDGGTTIVGIMRASGVQAPTVPTAPASLGVISQSTQNTITGSTTGGGLTVTGYDVYKGTTSGALTLAASNQSLPYVDGSLTNGTAYYYQLKGVNSLGSGTSSAEFGKVAGHYFVHSATGTKFSVPTDTTMAPGNTNAASLLDLRVDAELTTWISGSLPSSLLGKWSTTAANCQYQVYVDANGFLAVQYYNPANTLQVAVSSVRIPYRDGYGGGLRVVVNASNASKNTSDSVAIAAGSAQFFTSNDMVTWTALGTAFTGMTQTGFRDTGTLSALSAGLNGDGTGSGSGAGFIGRLWRAQLVVATTTIADLQIYTKTAGFGTATDSANGSWTWTQSGSASGIV